MPELLLQAHEGFLRVLPARKANWQNGNIKGIKARGNIEVDIEWMDGKLIKLGLLSAATKTTKIKYGSEEVEIELPKNKKIWLNSILKK